MPEGLERNNAHTTRRKQRERDCCSQGRPFRLFCGQPGTALREQLWVTRWQFPAGEGWAAGGGGAPTRPFTVLSMATILPKFLKPNRTPKMVKYEEYRKNRATVHTTSVTACPARPGQRSETMLREGSRGNRCCHRYVNRPANVSSSSPSVHRVQTVSDRKPRAYKTRSAHDGPRLICAHALALSLSSAHCCILEVVCAEVRGQTACRAPGEGPGSAGWGWPAARTSAPTAR